MTIFFDYRRHCCNVQCIRIPAMTPQTEALPPPSAHAIKHRLREQGQTLKSFAAAHGFRYRTVREVVAGIRRGHYGEGRKVRIALGLPVLD